MSNEQFKVSIIVAVYNVEKYIRRCLDSLQSQSHRNIEILLVDDGSKDESGKVCDEYAVNDTRFIVIHKENGGVSKARQAGLDAATGDYIIHADPDDYVETNMIEELLAEAVNKQTDIISCDFYLDGKYYKQGYKDEKDFLAKIINIGIISACWNVLVKRSFIVKHNIRFTPDWINQSEDFLFMARLLTAGATATHLNKAFYYYWSYNSNSLSNKRSLMKIKSLIATVEELEKIVDQNNYDAFFSRKKYILNRIFCERFYSMLNIYPEIHKRLITEGHNSSIHSQSYCLALALDGKRRKAVMFQTYIKIYYKFNRAIKKFLHK